MLNVNLDPRAALKAVLKAKSVTAVANDMLNGDRNAVRRYRDGRIEFGAGNLSRFVPYFNTEIDKNFGMPVLNWLNLPVTGFFSNIKKAADDLGSAQQVAKKSAKEFYFASYTRPGFFCTCVHDVSEEKMGNHRDTARRALLNVYGMHVARGFAETHPTSHTPKAADVVHLALHRSRVAAKLVQYAIEECDPVAHPDDMLQLKLMAAYVRMNRVAVVSMFRDSIAEVRKVSFFADIDVQKEVEASADVDLNGLLTAYKRGHPDRFLIASNALVFASLTRSASEAITAWKIMIDERASTVDLAAELETHERPLAYSPDTAWLVEANGGSYKLIADEGIYFAVKENGNA